MKFNHIFLKNKIKCGQIRDTLGMQDSFQTKEMMSLINMGPLLLDKIIDSFKIKKPETPIKITQI